eukprot:1125466-Alexandrium_andersonii.AAC.1
MMRLSMNDWANALQTDWITAWVKRFAPWPPQKYSVGVHIGTFALFACPAWILLPGPCAAIAKDCAGRGWAGCGSDFATLRLRTSRPREAPVAAAD